MSSIEKHILDLLQTEECVVLPGLGGFVVRDESAHYDADQHKFSPPHRTVSFNQKLDKDDGLLADAIKRETDMSFSEAKAQLSEFILSIQNQLKAGREFSLSELGRLHTNSAGKVQFTPTNTGVSNTEFYGLETFFAVPKLEQEEKPTQSQAPLIKEIESRKIFPFKAAGVVAIGLAGATYLTWAIIGTGVVRQRQQFQLSDLNPFASKICAVYQPLSNSHTSIKIEAESSFFPDKLSANSIKLVDDLPGKLHISSQKATGSRLITQGEFHIIAGCFKDYNNASKLVLELKSAGYPAQIIGQKNGLYRVSALNDRSKKALRIKLNRFKRLENKTAWIDSF